mgnify:CR=1 FL=1
MTILVLLDAMTHRNGNPSPLHTLKQSGSMEHRAVRDLPRETVTQIVLIDP